MAIAIYTKYGYREHNNDNEKWELLENNECTVDTDLLIDELYEEYGEELWHNMEIINDSTIIFSVISFSAKPYIKWKITIFDKNLNVI